MACGSQLCVIPQKRRIKLASEPNHRGSQVLTKFATSHFTSHKNETEKSDQNKLVHYDQNCNNKEQHKIIKLKRLTLWIEEHQFRPGKVPWETTGGRTGRVEACASIWGPQAVKATNPRLRGVLIEKLRVGVIDWQGRRSLVVGGELWRRRWWWWCSDVAGSGPWNWERAGVKKTERGGGMEGRRERKGSFRGRERTRKKEEGTRRLSESARDRPLVTAVAPPK